MSEVDALFNAATAVLLICLMFHHPVIALRFGRLGFVSLVAGSLIPLLDFVLFYFRAEDRISYLVQDHLFYGLFYGLLLIALLAALGRLLGSVRLGETMLLFLAGGYFLHLLLALLTPSGVPLLAPYYAQRTALPMFFPGHTLLLIVLACVLAFLEALPRHGRFVFTVGLLLLVLYAGAGVGQYGYISFRASDLAGKDGQVYVEPANAWLTEWLVTVADEESYQIRRHAVHLREFDDPEVMPRWNDQTLMVRLLADETVNRFYSRVFRHPVVRMEENGSELTLIMQELEDQFPLVPGRTFYYEADRAEKNRFYQVQRFD